MPMMLFVFWIGVYPKTFLDKMGPSVEDFMSTFETKYAMTIEESDQEMLLAEKRILERE